MIAKGGRDAFAAFWGIPPGVALGAGTLVAVGVAVAAVWLLLTPGGQAVLFGFGKGYGAAGVGVGSLAGRLGIAAVKVAG